MNNKIKKGNHQKHWFLINKKSQVKIQEMAFVLVAVVFLFAIVFLFFSRFQYAQLQKSATEIRELRTVTMLRNVASLPELSCVEKSTCIDKDKLSVFDESPNMQNKFSSIWQSASVSKVSVEEIYPNSQEYIIYKKQTQESTITYSTYIPLCEEDMNSKCVIAKIKITTIVP